MVWLHNPFFAAPRAVQLDAETGLVGKQNDVSRVPSTTATPSTELDRTALFPSGVGGGGALARPSASGSTAAVPSGAAGDDELAAAKKEKAGAAGGVKGSGGAGTGAGGLEGAEDDDHRNHLHYRLGLTQTPHLPRIHIHHHLHEMRVPSERWTAHQIFYTFVLDGIGAAIISGAINFGIAYGTLQVLARGPPFPLTRA